jgi:hypothetical protein
MNQIYVNSFLKELLKLEIIYCNNILWAINQLNLDIEILFELNWNQKLKSKVYSKTIYLIEYE